MGKGLTPKQTLFVREYLRDLNATQAAIRAGYSERTAKAIACENLTRPAVAAAIEAAKARRAERVDITADDVLEKFWALATADPRELIEYRVGACRYCYGDGHRWQRTTAERDADFLRWGKLEQSVQLKSDLADDKGAFDERGGVGYDRTRAPHAECPECHGLGEGYTLVKDQRNVSKEAARLLAGVKETKDGIEVKMHDPVAALINIGKHLGMFIDRTDHTTGGKPLPPTQIAVVLVKK